MRQGPFFVVVAVISVLFGLGFLIIPDTVFSLYGGTYDAVGQLTARFFGSGLIALAIIYFTARELTAGAALSGLLWAGLIVNALYAILAVVGTLGGALNALGWADVVLNILLGAGFAYLLFARPASP